MIIRPTDLSDKLSLIHYNTHMMRVSPHHVRIDEEIHKTYKGIPAVEKQSFFGDKYSNESIMLNDHFSIIMDKQTGDIIDYTSSNNTPYMSFPREYNNISRDIVQDQPRTIAQFKDHVTLNDAGLSDNNHIFLTIDIFQNEFQLPFISTIGSILSFFSTLSLSLPFELSCIIDSDIGFNIVSLKTRKLYKRSVIEQMNKHYNLFNVIYDQIKKECNKEKRSVRVYVYTHIYGIYVKFINKNHPHITFVYNLNLTDHHKILQANEIYNKLQYSQSALFHILTNMNVPTVLDTFGTSINQGVF
jgi:hypothetical protein